MAAHADPTDPAHLSPEERIAEVAAILAEGVFRLRRQGISTPIPAIQENTESSGNGLEVSAASCPDGPRG